MLMTSLEHWLIIQHGPSHAGTVAVFFGRDTVMMAAGTPEPSSCPWWSTEFHSL